MGAGNIADFLSQSGGAADVASGVGSLSDLIPGIGELLGMGFTLDDLISGNFGALIDPFGIFGLEGVPKGAKTSGAASALQGEGGVAGELGQGIAALGGGKDSNVLSNPAFAHETNTLADALTWLSGQALPGWKAMGTTGEIANLPPPSGAPYSKGVNIMGVQSPAQLIGQLGKSPNLSAAQIQSILPQLEQLAKTPGMSVAGLKGALAPLITSADTTPTGVPLGTPAQYASQQTQSNDTTKTPFDFTQLLNIIPLFNLFGGGSSNSDTTNNTTNNSTTNNLMAALGLPGAGIYFPRPNAAHFGPLPAVPLQPMV